MRLRLYKVRASSRRAALGANLSADCGLTELERSQVEDAVEILETIEQDADEVGDKIVRRKMGNVVDRITKLLKFCQRKRK